MNFSIASTIDEALAALDAGARPIAGGSDLMVGHRQGKAPLPNDVVAIDRIAELGRIEQHDGGLTIGALVSHHVIEHHPVIASLWSALSDASALVGSPATRNVGTIGGNVMNASPAMDTGAPLVVLGAEVELVSVHGLRRLPIAELWTGPGRTTAASNELCTAVHLPAVAEHSGSAYVRLEYRRAMEIAVVGAAASVVLNEDAVASIAVALTAVAPTIISVDGLDDLTGRPIDDALLAAVAERAAAQARPISDLRASDRYRRHTVGVMARRSVEAAARRARGELVPVPVNRSVGIGAAS
ncbi:MAG: xanthine dehydrogenase family protein subunit M [Ilumatobacteraceae bacterium]